MRGTGIVGGVAGAATLICALGAAAAPPPARLRFTRERGAEACPDETGLRDGVARRLGADPFRDDAPRTITVRVARSGPGHGATIELEKGERRTRRTLRSPAPGCAELAAAIELAVSLAVDPLWQPPAEPEVEIVAEPAVVARPLPTDLGGVIATDEEPVPEPRRRGPWHIGVGSSLTFGSAPDLVIGVHLAVGVRVGRRYAISLEPWLTLPSGTSAPGGRVTLSTIAASLLGCRALGSVSLCAQVSAGVLQAVGEGDGFVERERVRSAFGAAGVRVLWAADVYPGIGVHVYGDVLFPVLRTRLVSRASGGNIEAWSSPWLLPGLGVAFVGNF